MICPHCKTDLSGELVYETFLRKYGGEKKALEAAEMYGATKTEGRWGREIGSYSLEEDRVVGYRCPDCGETWSK